MINMRIRALHITILGPVLFAQSTGIDGEL